MREVESLKKAYSDAGETVKWYSDKMAKATEESGKAGKAAENTGEKVKSSVEGTSKSVNKAAEAVKTFADKIKELGSSVQSLEGTLKSLTSVYDQLNEGKALDLSNTMELAAKYPEYGAALISATGNAEKQKEVIKLLFEAKKQDLILKDRNV